MKSALIVKKKEAQSIRQQLERFGFWDRCRRLKLVFDEHVAIPITVDKLSWEDIGLSDQSASCWIEQIHLPQSKTTKLETPLACLKREVSEILRNAGRVASPELLADLPSRWEKHGDFILVSEFTLCSDVWSQLGEKFWKTVCECLGASRLGRKSSVSTDGYRSPKVTLLYGKDGWVDHVDNGIRYTYDVTRCMFSIGNITEKLRVAQFDCRGQTVLDLYSGIGYFTLPYLVHAKAERVIACEWNPSAVEALNQNLKLNNVQERCTVYQGDNRQTCPRNVADRVNLGLIPSSEPGWPVACAALRFDSGGFLHIHGNVDSKPSGTLNPPASTDVSPKDKATPASIEESNKETSPGGGCGSDVKKRALGECISGLNNKNGGTIIGKEFDDGEHLKRTGDCSVVCDDKGATESSVGSSLGHRTDPCGEERVSSCESDGCHFSDYPASSTDLISDISQHEKVSLEMELKQVKLSCNQKIKPAWKDWAEDVSSKIGDILESHHEGPWVVKVLHIEHVKSYAPHIDHLVLDLECRPCR